MLSVERNLLSSLWRAFNSVLLFSFLSAKRKTSRLQSHRGLHRLRSEPDDGGRILHLRAFQPPSLDDQRRRFTFRSQQTSTTSSIPDSVFSLKRQIHKKFVYSNQNLIFESEYTE